MVKYSSRYGKKTTQFLLLMTMTGMLAACGGGSGDTTDTTDTTGTETDPNTVDSDNDGIPDIDDNFIDTDGDGFDDITGLTEEEANGTAVNAENPCGGETGRDNNSDTSTWNDNCTIKRSSEGGQFADSLYSVGIQRVLFCSGYGTGTDYRVFADGEFGPNSEEAAQDFQAAEGLTSDGVIGPQSWGRLQEKLVLLTAGDEAGSHDTYGFSEGICADIPMFYQTLEVVTGEPGLQATSWLLADNEPNETNQVPFSIASPFGRLTTP